MLGRLRRSVIHGTVDRAQARAPRPPRAKEAVGAAQTARRALEDLETRLMKRVTAIDERIGLLEAPPGVEDLRADLGEVRDALKEAIESAREMSAREMRDTVASNVSSARNAIEENVGRAIAKLQ